MTRTMEDTEASPRELPRDNDGENFSEEPHSEDGGKSALRAMGSAPNRKRASRDPTDDDAAEESPSKNRRLSDQENVENHADTRSSRSSQRRSRPREEVGGALQESCGRYPDESEAKNLQQSRPTRRREGSASGKPAEAGIILQVYMENFMCHAKLKVDMNRNVNFIHGQNGSGKSAILAAIQICLGAGARRTHRARNLKGLIRQETAAGIAPTQAKVRVKLLNEGSDGYKSDIYGRTITVERTISMNGGYNGYKLLDEDQNEKSREKKDLDEMLDTLNIQVDNPVAVLDQEEAKKFLTGKAEDKYNFFLKACELERIDRTYANTLDAVAEMDASKDKIKQSVDQAANRVEERRKKYERHRKLSDLQYKVQELSCKFAWALHQEASAEHENACQKLSDFQARAEKKRRELQEAEDAANSPNNEKSAHAQRIQELSVEATEQANTKQSIEEELKSLLVPYKAREREIGTIQRRLKSTQHTLQESRRKLKQAREEHLAKAGSAESDQARLTKELEENENELSSCSEKVNSLRQATSDALKAYEEMEPEVHQAKDALQQATRNLDIAERHVTDLRASSSGSSLRVFGPRVESVHRMMKEALERRKFRGPVAGPIGAHVKILEEHKIYADLCEFALGGGVLDRFVVTNDADRKILQEIRKKAGCNQDCGIFQTSDSPRYRVPGPPRGIETVASVLTVDNDLIFNCLADQCRFEKLGLGRSINETKELLITLDSSGRATVPGGVGQVYCLPRGDHWVVRGGQTAVISNERTAKKILQGDKRGALEAAQTDASRLKNEMQTLNMEHSRLEGRHTELSRVWNVAKRANQKNDQKISKLKDRIDAIKEELENIPSGDALDTSGFEEEIVQNEEAVATLQEHLSRSKAEQTDSDPEIQMLRQKLDDIVARNEKVLSDLKDAEAQMTQILETQSQQQNDLERRRERIAKYDETIGKHQENINELYEVKEERLRSARILHIRTSKLKEKREAENDVYQNNEEQEGIPDPTEEELEAIEPIRMEKEAKDIEARLKRQKQKVEEERKNQRLYDESPEEAYEAYIAAQKDLDKVSTECERVDDQISSMTKDMKKRKKLWKTFREHLDRKTQVHFSQMLSYNNYEGELVFDHHSSTKKLDLCVQKKGSAAASNAETNDVKALSGGERSYTTMCLLLALGESLETPFRILDEFDVFLDTQVRKLTIKSLIYTAKKMTHRQFIFITPQDLSGIDPDPMVQILKLNPPVRHANAGGPVQQTLNFSQG